MSLLRRRTMMIAAQTEIGKNLFTNWIEKCILNASGNAEYGNPYFVTTDYIGIKNYHQYCVKVLNTHPDKLKTLYFYDDDKGYISDTGFDFKNTNEQIIEIPDTAKYVRYTSRAGQESFVEFYRLL